KPKKYSVPTKSLCLIPQRFAIEMVNRGWILRNTIIWHKPNCMPSSAKDRFTVDFEYVYFFVKSKEYWFEQQFDNYDNKPLNRWGGDIQKSRTEKKTIYEKAMKLGRTSKLVAGAVRPNPVGRNKRAVWTIPTQPFPEAHFAVYPETLIEPMIRAGCPEFVCKKCGKARVKIYKHEKMNVRSHKLSKGKVKDAVDGKNKDYNVGGGFSRTGVQFEWNHISVGYSDCGCNAGWESGIICDPFMGAGTTALVALKQRKRFIGIEIKQSYIDMSYKRIAKVQQKIF
ncbi:site-specific DNA-methyltransferase, partial [Candidatus Atribacteria bacterium 1244-E10-H5-B2]